MDAMKRPDQLLGAGFNALLLPDFTERFSWIVSGPRQIETDTEILVDYGNQFWGPPSVTTLEHAPPVEGIEDQAPPGVSPGTCRRSPQIRREMGPGITGRTIGHNT